MSRQSVRDAVAAWLGGTADPVISCRYTGGPTTPLLGAVYSSPPRVMPDADFTAGQGDGVLTGAAAVIRILREDEQRMAGAWQTGIKRKGYEVAIDVYVLSRQELAEDAMADADTVFDAVADRVRSNPTLGGALFSVGEGDVAGSSGSRGQFAWSFEEPTVDPDSGVMQFYARLIVAAVEHVTG